MRSTVTAPGIELKYNHICPVSDFSHLMCNKRKTLMLYADARTYSHANGGHKLPQIHVHRRWLIFAFGRRLYNRGAPVEGGHRREAAKPQ